MKNRYKLFLILILLVPTSSYCQKARLPKYHVTSEENLHSAINEIIAKEWYVDERKRLGLIIFTLKVDSVGEIHSAHIRRATNLKEDEYYNVCRMIENEVNGTFMYERFQHYVRSNKNYVTCDYTFSTEK